MGTFDDDTSLATLEKHSATAPNRTRKTTGRPVFIFDVPEDAADIADWGTEDEVKTVGLKLLSVREERDVVARAQHPSHIAHNLVIASLVEVNGEAVSTENGTADVRFAAMHPAMRAMCMEAYAELTTAKESVRKGFLGSKRVRV